ncbi:hypothetical protein DENSPDRAFT_836589 [Dentipellis sp. KUC8613]|nr:hypothetical protein DENSPDRAFT_836589 [Dentipellis sp. KUC8613]
MRTRQLRARCPAAYHPLFDDVASCFPRSSPLTQAAPNEDLRCFSRRPSKLRPACFIKNIRIFCLECFAIMHGYRGPTSSGPIHFHDT